MTDSQKKLVQLLEEEKTIDQLSKEMMLTPRQLYQRLQTLKNQGYFIKRRDYSTGDVSYFLNYDLSRKEESGSKIIYTSPIERTLKAIIVSDMHLGNNLAREDILDKIYDHCIKNDIHIIFNTGDFLNGFNQSKCGLPMTGSYEQQFQYAIKKFPFDPNIINYLVLGNHDYDFIKEQGINLMTKLTSKRFDIFPVSYYQGIIKLKNDSILLVHPKSSNGVCMEKKITFRGHSHKNKMISKDNKLYVYVPTCSDMIYDSSFNYPSILETAFDFSESGYIQKIDISTYIYIDRFVKTGEFSQKLNCSGNIQQILHEKTPPQKVKKMNQLEKFELRYQKNTK